MGSCHLDYFPVRVTNALKLIEQLLLAVTHMSSSEQWSESHVIAFLYIVQPKHFPGLKGLLKRFLIIKESKFMRSRVFLYYIGWCDTQIFSVKIFFCYILVYPRNDHIYDHNELKKKIDHSSKIDKFLCKIPVLLSWL